MKIYVTKFALTKGVYAAEAAVYSKGFAVIDGRDFEHDTYLHGEGREWCRTEADAISVAEKMKAHAIELTEKKLAKLRGLNFLLVEA